MGGAKISRNPPGIGKRTQLPSKGNCVFDRSPNRAHVRRIALMFSLLERDERHNPLLPFGEED